MSHNYSFSTILKNATLLEAQLRQLDISKLNIHSSVSSYFNFDLKKLSYVSECNAFMAYHLLKNYSSKNTNILIIDHGAGIGLFTLLIKKLGLSCICHDLSEEYLDGIRIIGQNIGLYPDHYVKGDTDALVEYCRLKNLKPTGLASRNVIEHIHDYKDFFQQIKVLSHQEFKMMICTSANPHNPLVKKIHIDIHSKYENLGSNIDMDNPNLNTSNCGMTIRKNLIKKHYPELNSNQLELLARINRGFLEKVILQRTQYFLDTGNLPQKFDHPSNTCDPYTGAWVERLVPVNDFRAAAAAHGFELHVLNGFYNTHYSKSYLNFITRILNLILKIVPDGFTFLSPFLAMEFKCNNKRNDNFTDN